MSSERLLQYDLFCSADRRLRRVIQSPLYQSGNSHPPVSQNAGAKILPRPF